MKKYHNVGWMMHQGKCILIILLISVLCASVMAVDIQDQGGAIQEVTGLIGEGDVHFYTIEGVNAGDILYVYAEGTSGNLDPRIALTDEHLNLEAVREDYKASIDAAIAAGKDPITVVEDISDKWFLVWDDDSGQGYDAAISYEIPGEGPYQLLITSSTFTDTFGEYRMLVGVNAPDVMTGDALPNTNTIAAFDKHASSSNVALQVKTGQITANETIITYFLNDINIDDVLYVSATRISGDFFPSLMLTDFAAKPIKTGNIGGINPTTATLMYAFDEPAKGYKLILFGCCPDATQAPGTYRLVIGLNAPEALSGDITERGNPVILDPTVIQVGIKLQQITFVDQVGENYGAVASLLMRWHDPALAYDPTPCNCDFKVYSYDDFIDYTVENNLRWPEFTLYNQQERRWEQNRIVVVYPDGEAYYFERFWAKLQAPDFDFKKYPFDTQNFYIKIDSLYGERFYVYEVMEGYSEVGDQLGEEEWMVINSSTEVTTEITSTGQPVSRFTFGFETVRHLNYYIFRIFVPIIILITISWFIFFLRDYTKRIEAASANLLIFVAFNFTISNDIPRLGYMTIMDWILITTFAVTGTSVLINVVLKLLEVKGKTDLAARIDNWVSWIYPIFYAVVILNIFLLFTDTKIF